MKPLVYLAAPFFNAEQLETVEKLESIINESGWKLFSPRLGDNSLVMNAVYARKELPSDDLRLKVFTDNVVSIDHSDLMLAVVDDKDTGVMFEMGYAFRAHVPIVTFTSRDYGVNLMLAHSVIGHVKTFDAVAHVLKIGLPALELGKGALEYGTAIAEIQHYYKTSQSLKEGPDERKRSNC
jgi:nucleoside 2-deoxyribosyltransferase